MSETWHEFYFMIGTTAGALIGLLFVVVSLGGNVDPARRRAGVRIYVSPIVVHFASVLFVSALALVPELSQTTLGALMLIPSAGGLFYVVDIVRRFFFGALPTLPHWTDPIFYAALPAVAYLTLTATALAFLLGWPYGPDALAAGAVGLLFLGIRDAWDIASWLATRSGSEDR